MLLDSSNCSLVYPTAADAAFLVSAFYLNQGAAPAIGGGRSSNLLAGQEMKLPAFSWAARWDHMTLTGSGGVSEEQEHL